MHFKLGQENGLLRPWDLNIQILRDSTLSIHAQIAKAIIQDIKSGRLISGTALPGSRLLAHKIQVNRKTVIQAYDDLVALGWLHTQNKRGTFVAHRHQASIQTQLISIQNNRLNDYAVVKKVASTGAGKDAPGNHAGTEQLNQSARPLLATFDYRCGHCF